MKIRKKLNDKRKRGGAEKVGQSGIGRKSLPLIVISFFFNLNLPHFQISFLTVYHSLTLLMIILKALLSGRKSNGIRL